jgi:hypothetical protein
MIGLIYFFARRRPCVGCIRRQGPLSGNGGDDESGSAGKL